MIRLKKRNKNITKIFLGIVLVMLLLLLTNCDGSNNKSIDNKKTKQQEISFDDMFNKIKDPNITKWTEAKQLKKIYELRDDSKLICYLYTKSERTGKYIFEGRCQGFGIPYSTQFSNPEKVVNYEDELDESLYEEPAGTIAQPEPNGLFMPTSSSATWIIMIDEKGNTEVQYYESLITVTQTKKRSEMCETWSLPSDY